MLGECFHLLTAEIRCGVVNNISFSQNGFVNNGHCSVYFRPGLTPKEQKLTWNQIVPAGYRRNIKKKKKNKKNTEINSGRGVFKEQ